MAKREGCAVDVAIHAPYKQGDQRNHHAHILELPRFRGSSSLSVDQAASKTRRRSNSKLARP